MGSCSPSPVVELSTVRACFPSLAPPSHPRRLPAADSALRAYVRHPCVFSPRRNESEGEVSRTFSATVALSSHAALGGCGGIYILRSKRSTCANCIFVTVRICGHGPRHARDWVRLFDTSTRRGLSLLNIATMIPSSSQHSTEPLICRMTMTDGACLLRAVWRNS